MCDGKAQQNDSIEHRRIEPVPDCPHQFNRYLLTFKIFRALLKNYLPLFLTLMILFYPIEVSRICFS